ncbi:Potassium channel domain-containing protein [Caenorhabditis elegans]|uniref:Potassium channel domain-containing protein n=1 Tax=Caenorhabditis elegans TaxID=6239 RepID=H2KZ65_CAEEL|nr:Potassium channel domain-containing protein [Caenorhabditis elegans]CCD66543.2 Potassium channel domain-containing protein [Caenorhabditis elegans]|eukprot:NP_001343632.1 TWiK family of potassium channels [Caenorhabditis elegans]
MSNDNLAIEIDPPDDVEYDVEAGFNSSTCHLMHNFEEERPTSLVASIKESAISSKRKLKYYCSFICTPIKKLLSTFKLLIIIGLYSFIGAHIFMYLEVPTDLEAREDGFHQRKIAREVMVLNLRAIFYDNREDREERWKHAILKFEEDIGLEEPVIETVWTFWMSFLYAGTIFTTIGYGNIACKTRAGQIATMVYAFVGIPIMLVMLTSLNNFLLKWIKLITNGVSDMTLYIGVRLGITVIRQDEVQKRLRYTKLAKTMKRWKLSKHGAPSSIAISNSEENRLNSTPEDDEEEEEIHQDPPVLSTLIATVAWIILSAAVFCLFEDWTFFTSFYFCFISLTTIGLGDVTPANPEYMIATFGVVIVGLSMLTVCIDVLQEKLAQMYMALLQKLLTEYMEAVKSGDPNAASAMMAGFQGRAKFLMPLISKNEGAKVMDKFKQDCSKKGIDPPPVLTNINPETGMPAFANAPKEDFRDYIEVADEKFADEQQRLSQTPLSKSTDFLQSPTPRPTVTVAVTQTARPQACVSLEVQAGTTMGKFHDYGSQTQTESSDEGIQTDYSIDFDDEKNKEPEKVMADIGTQYEIVLLTSIGIQPEVSSIYIGAGLSDHSDEESGCESEDDSDDSDVSSDEESELKSSAKYKETPLPFEVEDPGMMSLGLQSPPIEITPFTDDESAASDARSSPVPPTSSKRSKLTPKTIKVGKSLSMDSTDTVIHVKPVGVNDDEKRSEEKESKDQETNDDLKTESGQEKKRRKKKKKLRSKKTREHELRFLKNSGNQASPLLMDCSTQYEIFTVESGSQYDVKGRSRKCQTKLSSINHEQLQGIRETVQKLRRRESEMSKVSNVSESDWDSETGKEPEVAEISLDLSVVALGVDESGKVVDIPKEVPKAVQRHESFSPTSELTTASESLSAEKVHLDSEDEELESLEELELYTTDAGIQTETKVMLDKQDNATPKLLEIIKNCSTQTTFSTFHIPQKVYESASTSSDEEDHKNDGEDEKQKKSKQEVFFMTNTGVQTMHTSFHIDEKPKFVEENLQTQNTHDGIKEQSAVDEEMPLFLKNSDCQTVEVISFECATSTENVSFVGDVETSEGSSQTAMQVSETEVQTMQQEFVVATMQTDEPLLVSDESQTEQTKSSEIDSQTDPPSTKSFICQTELITSSEVEVQAVRAVEFSLVECQTDALNHEEVEVQTELDISVSQSQTDNVDVGHIEMQTDMTITNASESQTDVLSVGDTEMQTDEKEIFTIESQTEQPSTELQETQTDDVSFAGDVPTTDQITQSESAQVFDSETQYALSIEEKDVQATPISFETQTQHSIELEVKSCQTEGVRMKNKKSQVYVQELDEERRMRMSDIGIQTGVLARVQHIYTRPISDDVGPSSSAPITLRKSSDSSEHISTKTAKSSEESLAPSASGTALSAAESMDDHLWPERASPFASRHGSLKRRTRELDPEKKGDKTNIVQDLRARFEMKSPPKSPPKDDEEGTSTDPKHFF